MVLGVAAVLASIVALRAAGPHGRARARRRRRPGARPCRRGWPTPAWWATLLMLAHRRAADLRRRPQPDDGQGLRRGRIHHRTTTATSAPRRPRSTGIQSVLAHLASISTAGVWMRLPATAAAIGTWLLLSRCRAAAAGQPAGPRTGPPCGPPARCSWPPGCRSATACAQSRSSPSAWSLSWMLVETLGGHRAGCAPTAAAIVVAVFSRDAGTAGTDRTGPAARRRPEDQPGHLRAPPRTWCLAASAGPAGRGRLR